MNPRDPQFIVAAWLGITSLAALLLFGFDKWQAGRKGARVAESTLWWVSALGGWPGGLLAILLFRHKSAKGSFQLKFAAAFVVWVALIWGAGRLTEGKLTAGSDSWSRSDLAAEPGKSAAGSPRLQQKGGCLT